jgi:fatty-acyl-CoA synthase
MKNVLHLGQMLTAHARLSPQRIGACDLERSMTFHQWNSRACRLANALNGLGLSKGDRVAILAYNAVEWVEVYAATAKAGLVAVPLNFRLVGNEIRYIVDDAEAAAIIVQDELVGALEDVGPELSVQSSRRIWFGTGQCPAGYVSYEKLMAGARDSEPDVSVTPEDPWMLVYTSGTTGTPKGAIRNHRGGAMLSHHEDRTRHAPQRWRHARYADAAQELALIH